MDKYTIDAEVVRTEEYRNDVRLWNIVCQYRPKGTIARRTEYLLPKDFTPPRVGDKIRITVEVKDD